MATGETVTRLLLIGALGSEFRLAAAIAHDAGAEVIAVDGIAAALATARAGGADLAMVDVATDIAGFIAELRHERIGMPVYACGIDAPAACAVAAIRAGACDYLPLPPDRALIAAAIVAVAGQLGAPVGKDPAFIRAMSLGLALAPARTPFIIVGEPGAGRQVLARAVHSASGRRGRFIVLDCAVSDRSILESELFGHEAGTFPGAVARRCGRIEAADNGTLMLREVTLLPLATQARLAELLHDHVCHAGPAAKRPARIIASTAFDLEARVADGRFSAELLTQLGLVRLTVPPLRERGDDILLLARHFGERFATVNGLPVRPFGDDAVRALLGHDWPGNVRELEEVVHRAVLFSHDRTIAASVIMLADGGRLIRRDKLGLPSFAPNATACSGRLDIVVGSTVEEVERALILETLRACSGNRTSASTILGISVRTMRNKLKAFVEAGIAVCPAL